MDFRGSDVEDVAGRFEGVIGVSASGSWNVMVANSAVHLTVLQRSSVESAEDAGSSGAAVEDGDGACVEESASRGGYDRGLREGSHGGVGGRGALLAGMEHELTKELILSVRMPIA